MCALNLQLSASFFFFFFSLVHVLCFAVFRFRLDTSGTDALMGKLVKTTLNELVNEYALRFALKQTTSAITQQFTAFMAQASTSAVAAQQHRTKFAEMMKADRTTLLKYYLECPYFKSPKVLEAEINCIQLLESVLIGYVHVWLCLRTIFVFLCVLCMC